MARSSTSSVEIGKVKAKKFIKPVRNIVRFNVATEGLNKSQEDYEHATCLVES